MNAVRYHSLSYILLGYSFVISLCMFSLMPFLILKFGDLFEVSTNFVSLILAISIAVGATVALLISLYSTARKLKLLLTLSSISFVASMASLLFAFSSLNLVILFVALLLLRLSLALGTNVTRSLHMLTNPDIDKTSLFAYMSMSFGLGSAVGPMLGSLFFKFFDIEMLVALIVVLSMSVTLVTLWKVYKLDLNAGSMEPTQGLRYQDLAKTLNASKSILLICVIGYAIIGQTLSYIPMKIDKITLDSDLWIGAFFLVNSSLLIATPLLLKILPKVIASQLMLMSFFLILALYSLSLENLGPSAVIFSCIVFSFGEAVIYSVGMNRFLSKHSLKNTTSIVAVFNFLTLFVGTNLGQLSGTLIFNQSSLMLELFVWSITLAALVFLVQHDSKSEKSISTEKAIRP